MASSGPKGWSASQSRVPRHVFSAAMGLLAPAAPTHKSAVFVRGLASATKQLTATSTSATAVMTAGRRACASADIIALILAPIPFLQLAMPADAHSHAPLAHDHAPRNTRNAAAAHGLENCGKRTPPHRWVLQGGSQEAPYP